MATGVERQKSKGHAWSSHTKSTEMTRMPPVSCLDIIADIPYIRREQGAIIEELGRTAVSFAPNLQYRPLQHRDKDFTNFIC